MNATDESENRIIHFSHITRATINACKSCRCWAHVNCGHLPLRTCVWESDVHVRVGLSFWNEFNMFLAKILLLAFRFFFFSFSSYSRSRRGVGISLMLDNAKSTRLVNDHFSNCDGNPLNAPTGERLKIAELQSDKYYCAFLLINREKR